MSLPTNGTPVSGLQELLKLTANKDVLIIQTEDGTKIMQASILCHELMELLCGNSAQAHNAIFRGKNLTDVYTEDELSAKIQANDWSDLFIGDYIEKEITTSYGGTEKVRLLFAHFDYFLTAGDTATTKHHIVMVPEDCFATLAQMNETNTTEGGYSGCAMQTTVLPVYAAALKGALGSTHVLTHRRLLTTSVSATAQSTGLSATGISNGWAWADVDLCLMSEPMLYGTRAFSSSGYDVADGNMQFALFTLAPNKKIAHKGFENGSRYDFWLCAVASAAGFAYCAVSGLAGYAGASTSTGVRPYFLFA